jgi:hypothetical protein
MAYLWQLSGQVTDCVGTDHVIGMSREQMDKECGKPAAVSLRAWRPICR